MRKPWRVNNWHLEDEANGTFVFYSPERVADRQAGFKMPAYRRCYAGLAHPSYDL